MSFQIYAFRMSFTMMLNAALLNNSKTGSHLGDSSCKLIRHMFIPLWLIKPLQNRLTVDNNKIKITTC